MNRKGKVFLKDRLAGEVWEDDDGYHFSYKEQYIKDPVYGAISLTLPLSEKVYTYRNMIPFFDGLIPEGWLLNIAVNKMEISHRDRMGLLLTVCKDCIGAVSIINEEYGE